MLRILTRDHLETDGRAFDQMFRARAAVFHDRLGWRVSVEEGWEKDHYDDTEDPVYLVTEGSSGTLTGSLRILPTTGATMLKSEFRHFFDHPVDVDSPTTWECTRFCVHPVVQQSDQQLSRSVATELLSGLCDLALDAGIESIVGVYDAAMAGVYRRLGWMPTPLARSRPEVGDLYVGLWEVNSEKREALRSKLSQLLAPISLIRAVPALNESERLP